jgi:hypothetical protein
MAVEKTLRLESTERFPLSPATTTRVRLIPKVCGAEKETKEQSNGVSENLNTQMRPSDRGI